MTLAYVRQRYAYAKAGDVRWLVTGDAQTFGPGVSRYVPAGWVRSYGQNQTSRVPSRHISGRPDARWTPSRGIRSYCAIMHTHGMLGRLVAFSRRRLAKITS